MIFFLGLPRTLWRCCEKIRRGCAALVEVCVSCSAFMCVYTSVSLLLKHVVLFGEVWLGVISILQIRECAFVWQHHKCCVSYFSPPFHTHKGIDTHKRTHTHAHSPPSPFVFFGQYSSAALLPRVLCGSPTGAPLLECSVSHISTQHTLAPVQIIRNFTNGKPARNSEKACAYM